MSSKTAKNHSSDLIKGLLDSIPEKQKEQTRRKMLLAAKIDDGIKAKGWSRVELAEKLGRYPSEVTKWLSGTHNFTTDTLWEIQDVLDIKLIDLDKQPSEVVQTITATAVSHLPLATKHYREYYSIFERTENRVDLAIVKLAGFTCMAAVATEALFQRREKDKPSQIIVPSLHG